MSDNYENNGIFRENGANETKMNEADTSPAENSPETVVSPVQDQTAEKTDSAEGSIVFDHSGPASEKAVQEQMPGDRYTSAAIPSYASYIRSDGEILYTPIQGSETSRKTKKEKKRKIAEEKRRRQAHRGTNWAAVTVLVIVSMLLSASCGFLGAHFANAFYSETPSGADNGGGTSASTSQTLVVHQSSSVSSEGSNLQYADVVAKVENSVVSITTEYMVTSFWGQYVTGGAGSGVIISADGYIATNNHVICGSDGNTVADTIKIKLKNNDEYNAVLIGTDSTADIALLKINASDLTFAEFCDSDTLVVGEEVIAIGNPLGELSGTATNGIISALAREIEVEGVKMNLIQTNTAINPGNSGGGLFNMKGQLIGVVNAKSSGTGIEGLGFAIPANDALATITHLKEGSGNPSTTMIGIQIADIDSTMASRYGYRTPGVYIIDVQKGYNDDVLKVNDRIVAVDGEEITSSNEAIAIVKASEPGDELEFTIIRQSRTLTVTVTCYEPTDTNINFEF